MKKKLLFSLVLYFTMFFSFTMVSCSTIQSNKVSYSLSDLIGVWEGSYFANQGETGLTLTVWEENGNYKATFYFFNILGKTDTSLLPIGRDGSYLMTVTSNHSTKKYNLVGYEWVNIPDVPNTSWHFVDLEGTISGNVFTGNALAHGNSLTFKVVKK